MQDAWSGDRPGSLTITELVQRYTQEVEEDAGWRSCRAEEGAMPARVRGFPAADRGLEAKETQSAYKLHRRKLKGVKSKLDNASPPVYGHVILHSKQLEAAEERMAAVHYENARLFHRMQTIMRRPGRGSESVQDRCSHHLASARRQRRRQSERAVAEDNLRISNKILFAKSDYDARALHRQYRAHKKDLARIANPWVSRRKAKLRRSNTDALSGFHGTMAEAAEERLRKVKVTLTSGKRRPSGKHVTFANPSGDFIFEDAGDGGEGGGGGGDAAEARTRRLKRDEERKRKRRDPAAERARQREARARRRRRQRLKARGDMAASSKQSKAGACQPEQAEAGDAASCSNSLTPRQLSSRRRHSRYLFRSADEDARKLMRLAQCGGSTEAVLSETLVRRSNKHRLEVKERFRDFYELDPVEALTERLGPDWRTLVDVLLEDLRSRTERVVENPLPLTVLRLKSSIKFQTRDFVELLVSCSDSIMATVREAYKHVTQADLLWEVEDNCGLNPTVDVLLELARKGDKVKVRGKDREASLSRLSPMGYKLSPHLARKSPSKKDQTSPRSPYMSPGGRAYSPSGRLLSRGVNGPVKGKRSPSRGRLLSRRRKSAQRLRAASYGAGVGGSKEGRRLKLRGDVEGAEVLRLAQQRYQTSRMSAHDLYSLARLELTPDLPNDLETSLPPISCSVTRREGATPLPVPTPPPKESTSHSRLDAEDSVALAAAVKAKPKANPFRRCRSALEGACWGLVEEDASQGSTLPPDSAPSMGDGAGLQDRPAHARRMRAQSARELRNKVRAVVSECQSIEEALQEASAKAGGEGPQRPHTPLPDRTPPLQLPPSVRCTSVMEAVRCNSATAAETAAAADVEHADLPSTPVPRRVRTISYAQQTVLQASAIYGAGDFLKEGSAAKGRRAGRLGGSPSMPRTPQSPGVRPPEAARGSRRRFRWTRTGEGAVSATRSATHSALARTGRTPGSVSSLQRSERLKAAARSLSRSGERTALRARLSRSGQSPAQGTKLSRSGNSPALGTKLSRSGDSPGLGSRLSRSGDSPTLGSKLSRSGDSPALGSKLSRSGDSPALGSKLSRSGDSPALGSRLSRSSNSSALSTRLSRSGDSPALGTRLSRLGDSPTLSTRLSRSGHSPALGSRLSRSGDSPVLGARRVSSTVGETEGLRVCIEKCLSMATPLQSPALERVRASSSVGPYERPGSAADKVTSPSRTAAYSPLWRSGTPPAACVERSRGSKFPLTSVATSLRKPTPSPRPRHSATPPTSSKRQGARSLVAKGATGSSRWPSKPRRNFREDDLVRCRLLSGPSSLESTPRGQKSSADVGATASQSESTGADVCSGSGQTPRASLWPLPGTRTRSPSSRTRRPRSPGLTGSDTTKQDSPGRQHPEGAGRLQDDVTPTFTASDSSLDSLQSTEAGSLLLGMRQSRAEPRRHSPSTDRSGSGDTRQRSSTGLSASTTGHSSNHDRSSREEKEEEEEGEEEYEEDEEEDEEQRRRSGRLSSISTTSTSSTGSSGSSSSTYRRPWRYSSFSSSSDSGSSWTTEGSSHTADCSD